MKSKKSWLKEKEKFEEENDIVSDARHG